MSEQSGGTVLLERARIEALMRMLVESGDMTPMAVRTSAPLVRTVWWDKPGCHPGSDVLARMQQLGRGDG